MIYKRNFRKWDEEMGRAWICLVVGPYESVWWWALVNLFGGGPFWMRWWNCEFHKMLGNYLIAEDKKDSASYSHAVNICHTSVIGRWFFKSEMLFGLNMLCFKTTPRNTSNKKSCHHYSDTKSICRRYFQLYNPYELIFANEITEICTPTECNYWSFILSNETTEPTDVSNETTGATDVSNETTGATDVPNKSTEATDYRMKLLKTQTYLMKLLKLQTIEWNYWSYRQSIETTEAIDVPNKSTEATDVPNKSTEATDYRIETTEATDYRMNLLKLQTIEWNYWSYRRIEWNYWSYRRIAWDDWSYRRIKWNYWSYRRIE